MRQLEPEVVARSRLLQFVLAAFLRAERALELAHLLLEFGVALLQVLQLNEHQVITNIISCYINLFINYVFE